MRRENAWVAICVPYYKKINALKRLIQTIVNQVFESYLVIVTDDGMDNEAEKVISDLDERFMYYRNEIRLGPTENCNHAIRIAEQYHPAYIKVMHHDDYFNDAESLKKYVEMLDRDPMAVFAFSGSKTDIQMGREIYERCADAAQVKTLREDKYTILENNFIGAPSAVLVRNVGIRMDENLIWLVDVDWYLKLLEYRNCFVCTTEALIATGLDGNRVTDRCMSDMELVQKEWLYVYLKHSSMQDFSYLDQIMRQCIVYYKKKKGYWHEDDYLAILKDAVRDGKKICLCGMEEEGAKKGYRLLKDKGIKVDCRLDMTQQGNVDGPEEDDLPRMDFETLGKRKGDYFCIVMFRQAKEVRRTLAFKGINSIPYIEAYIEKLNEL